jgi:hypothetical protein
VSPVRIRVPPLIKVLQIAEKIVDTEFPKDFPTPIGTPVGTRISSPARCESFGW